MYDVLINNVIIASSNFDWTPFAGALAVEGGVIRDVLHSPVETAAAARAAREVVDGGGKILMPGLINGHCHGDMTFARGRGDGMTLGEQNDAFAGHDWFKAFISDEDRYYSRQLTYIEALLAGVTFVCENMYWTLGDDSLTAMAETGIRGALAEDIRRTFTDSDDFWPVAALERFAQKCRDQNLVPVIATMAEEDYEEKRLRAAHDIITGLGVLQTLHLAETDWRMKIIADKFGMTPVAYLDRLGVLGPHVIGSHGVHFSESDIERLADTGVKIVNTPLCEMKIQDGIAPIPSLCAAGVTVALGTDGAMWNNSLDLFREMKGMSLLHSLNSGVRSLSKKQILDMATINGATAFGVDSQIGTIEVGKYADCILLDASAPHLQPLCLGTDGNGETVTSALVYSATAGDVTDVFIGGKRIVQDRKLTTLDVRTVISKVNATRA